jgi:hypothetical protein
MFQALKDGINRRRHVRRTLDAAGVLQWPDGGNDVRCILEDISLGGARLRLEGPADLPHFFLLTVPTEQIDRACTVAWKDGERVGVRFLAR